MLMRKIYDLNIRDIESFSEYTRTGARDPSNLLTISRGHTLEPAYLQA